MLRHRQNRDQMQGFEDAELKLSFFAGTVLKMKSSGQEFKIKLESRQTQHWGRTSQRMREEADNKYTK